MSERAAKLRQEVLDLQAELAGAKAALEAEQFTCKHVWSEPRYKPIVLQKPGMVTDYYGPRPVERWSLGETKPSWERECSECFKTETTTRVEEKVDVKKTPVF